MAPIHYPLLALHTPRRNLYGPKCIYIICYPRRICKPLAGQSGQRRPNGRTDAANRKNFEKRLTDVTVNDTVTI